MRAPRLVWAGSARQTNFAFMSIWIVLFSVMMTTGFVTTEVVGTPHPGADPAFWERACNAHEYKACPTWVGMLNAQCEQGAGDACLTMGKVTDLGMWCLGSRQRRGAGWAGPAIWESRARARHSPSL